MESSIVDFFLDRTRSGTYYVDGSTAHRVLLDGCTLVMEEVYVKGVRLDMVGWGFEMHINMHVGTGRGIGERERSSKAAVLGWKTRIFFWRCIIL